MKNIITAFIICITMGADAITTYSGSIDINKSSRTQISVDYSFVLSQNDSIFTGDSFSSTISCPSSSTVIDLDGFTEVRRIKYFLNCERTSYRWGLTYRASIDLSKSKYSAIKNCCNLRVDATCGTRSSTITSLTSLLSDFYVYTEFENCSVIGNRTPASTTFPYFDNCLNQPFFYNQGRLDTADFDSLSYSLVAPLGGNGVSLNFASGYYADQPLTPFYPAGSQQYPFSDPKSSPPIGFSLDKITGDCIYTPTKEVEAGPVTLEMVEWRKDGTGTYQKISTSHIESFVSTVNCPSNNPPTISGPFDTVAIVGQTLCYNIYSDDVTFIPPPPTPIPSPDMVRLSWNRGIIGATFTIMNPGDRLETGRFCWTPGVDDVKVLPFTFSVTARDDACPRNALITRSFRIKVKKLAAISSFSKKVINVYPNPAYSEINLSQAFDKVVLLSTMGQVVMNKNNVAKLNVAELSEGVYYIRAEHKGIQYSGKFIKIASTD